MTTAQLLTAVRTGVMMRIAQNAYFKHRTDANLRNAKSLEAAFDKQSTEALNPAPVQGALFEEPAPKAASRPIWSLVTECLPRLTNESFEGECCFSNPVLVRYVEAGRDALPAATAICYDDGRWEDESGFELRVVAWMPIPAFEEQA